MGGKENEYRSILAKCEDSEPLLITVELVKFSQLQVVLSDASVPGEGEHKIMDYIRRLRSHKEHDPNTAHVIYGLDADLIMLSLATHEPYFRVLREDVFFQGNKPRGCHNCGQFGHHSANCTNPPMPKQPKTEDGDPKPFIWLDVSVLREYLEVELNVPGVPFGFDLERAIDDWVFLIFFVGNDFLPHLPSLEIREGAIDTLLQIWRVELPRMGGYVTEHGRVELQRLQYILDGLSSREADIFRKRRETEERSEARNAQIQQERAESKVRSMAPPSSSSSSRPPAAWQTKEPPEKKRKVNPESYEAVMALHANYVSVRQTNIGMGLPTKPSDTTITQAKEMNKAEVRDANMSAAERLKAELMGESLAEAEDDTDADAFLEEVTKELEEDKAKKPNGISKEDSIPGFGMYNETPLITEESPRGTKRKAEEPIEDSKAIDAEIDNLLDEDSKDSSDSDDETAIAAIPVKELAKATPAPLKMMGNNMVEQEDSVKLWEPGYQERYYRQKFGIEMSDAEFRKSIVKSYVEGLCWVLAYYYQGCPSVCWFSFKFHMLIFDKVELVLSSTFLAICFRL